MPAHPINCPYCHSRHWSFQKCEERKERETKQPPIQWGKSMEGSQLFGDRTHSFELLGGVNTVRKDKDG